MIRGLSIVLDRPRLLDALHERPQPTVQVRDLRGRLHGAFEPGAGSNELPIRRAFEEHVRGGMFLVTLANADP